MPGSSAVAEAPAATRLHCHRCSHFLGEAAIPLVLVGLLKDTELLKAVAPPRDTRRCKACGWVNVFKPS